MKEENIRKILDVLSEAKFGMTIIEIAEKISLNRATVSKYLEVLEAKGEVISREIGVYRLWLSKKLVQNRRIEIQSMFGNVFLKAIT